MEKGKVLWGRHTNTVNTIRLCNLSLLPPSSYPFHHALPTLPLSLPLSLSHCSGSVRSPRAQLNWPTPFHLCSVWLSQFHRELVQRQPPPLHQWNHEDTVSHHSTKLSSPFARISVSTIIAHLCYWVEILCTKLIIPFLNSYLGQQVRFSQL